MTNIEALDIIFSFFPEDVLENLKNEGLYDLVLAGKVNDGAEIYDFLKDEYAALQDADYEWLASAMKPILNDGSLLQIGCGRGDLLMRLATKGFKPIYGIDRSDVMLKKARERLERFKDVYLFCEKIENFDFSKLPEINNVIINNFWGMISKEKSVKLLKNLKNRISADGVIIIGPYSEEAPILKTIALKTLQENLGFTFSYPFYKDFAQCGYNSKIVEFSEIKYFILYLH